MATKSREYILDELLCFLSNPIFQVPVLTFMEDRCIVFDPEVDECREYRKTHEEYKQLVDRMLLSFEQDTGLSYSSIMSAVQEMNDKEDIRTIFQTILEQVMSSVDFDLYVRVMTHKNIVLQEEALQMIMKNLGGLPESLTKGKPQGESGGSRREEEAVLAAAIEKSSQDFEKQKKLDHLEEEELQAILLVSQAEAQRLSQSRRVEERKIDLVLRTCTSDKSSKREEVSDDPSVVTEASRATVKATSTNITKPQPNLQSAPQIALAQAPPVAGKRAAPKIPPTDSVPAPTSAPLVRPLRGGAAGPTVTDVSGADAAASWLKSAQAESGVQLQHTDRYQALQESMEAMTVKERQQRLVFLKEQRDKLVKMKKEEREKQLRRVESSQPQRPNSARAARAAMSQKPSAVQSDPEAEKRLAMRKAIADRLKSEVIDRQ